MTGRAAVGSWARNPGMIWDGAAVGAGAGASAGVAGDVSALAGWYGTTTPM